MMAMFRKIMRDKRGVGAIEYALIASLISIAAVTGYANLGHKVEARYNSVDQSLSNHL
jgi:Flp pilus assembly pilin Flp